MKTLRQQIEETAFWDGAVCLSCDAIIEEPNGTECPECGHLGVVSAARLMRWLARMEEDGE